MIDLHLHTTASDGRCSPAELVARVAQAGITVMAVSDHDTVAAVDEVRTIAAPRGIRSITGIEITAVEDGGDVHILGYFFDPANAQLAAFLTAQRQSRVTRVQEIANRLAALGMPVDVAPLITDAQRTSGRSIGRPQVARAMVAAGYATDMRDAFNRWLGDDGPGFVPRIGSPVADVVAVIHSASGLASMAHPGRTRRDGRIAEWRDAGLDALEAHHSDHTEQEVGRYRALASQLGMLITGGSDYHADPTRPIEPGTASLPQADWMRLDAAAGRHGGR